MIVKLLPSPQVQRMMSRRHRLSTASCKSSLLLPQAGREGEQSEVWEAATRLGNFLEAVAPPVLQGSQLEHHDVPQRCKRLLPVTPQRRPAEAVNSAKLHTLFMQFMKELLHSIMRWRSLP